MNISVDKYSTVGSEHLTNEDYIYVMKSNEESYLVLCDGCSASPLTDLGSRVIAHTLKRYLQDKQLSNKLSTDDLIRRSLNSAGNIVGQLNLSGRCLESTIILVTITDDVTNIFMYGDGVIITKTLGGLIQITEVSYKYNAPLYPIYQLGERKLIEYFENYPDQRLYILNTLIEVNGVRYANTSEYPLSESNCGYKFTSFCLSNKDLDSLIISTDGIQSFNVIDIKEIVDNVLDVKNFNGSFLERNMIWYKRQWERKDIVHTDDLTLGYLKYQHEDTSHNSCG